MHLKKNDTVKILSGKDKGKTGKILKILKSAQSKDRHMAVVEGLNLRYKHIRPKRTGEKGQRIMFPFAINISNLSLVCPKCGKATRVGYKSFDQALETTKEKKQRICKKCQAVI